MLEKCNCFFKERVNIENVKCIIPIGKKSLTASSTIAKVKASIFLNDLKNSIVR